jgi:hypothetical protein
MPTLDHSFPANRAPSHLHAALMVLAREAGALLGALLQPGRVLGEVEEMRRLLVAANALDATDPGRAALLRRRASPIGLR